MCSFCLPWYNCAQVVEMNCLRSPGMSPDFLYWIRDVHYFKWSLPLSMKSVLIQSPGFSCGVSNVLIIWIFLPMLSYLQTHITICSFSLILKFTDKLRVLPGWSPKPSSRYFSFLNGHLLDHYEFQEWLL